MRLCLKGSEVVEVSRSWAQLQPMLHRFGYKNWPLAKTCKNPIAFILEVLSCLRHICAFQSPFSTPPPNHPSVPAVMVTPRAPARPTPNCNICNNATVPNKALTYSPCIILILGTSVLWYRQIKFHIIIIWVWIPCSQNFEDFGDGFDSLTYHTVLCRTDLRQKLKQVYWWTDT